MLVSLEAEGGVAVCVGTGGGGGTGAEITAVIGSRAGAVVGAAVGRTVVAGIAVGSIPAPVARPCGGRLPIGLCEGGNGRIGGIFGVNFVTLPSKNGNVEEPLTGFRLGGSLDGVVGRTPRMSLTVGWGKRLAIKNNQTC